MNFQPMKAVYCYYLPETRNVLKAIDGKIPDELFFVTAQATNVKKKMKNIFPSLFIPTMYTGTVDLDAIHIPVMSRIVECYDQDIVGLDTFTWRYPSSGSSEGLFHILVDLKIKGVNEIYALEGEYEGYGIQAEHLGMHVHVVDLEKIHLEDLKKGYWFISNPSARDGNIVENDFIQKLCSLGHKIILDFAYVGSTHPYAFHVMHHNIIAVVMSFSKPYGVFRFRIGGFVFSRLEIKTLYGNKWFKDVVRLLEALALAESIGPRMLAQKYKSIQAKIVDKLNKEFDLGLKSSDAFLLAYMHEQDTEKLSEDKLKLIAPYKRGKVYRFCLTPYFEEYEHLKIQKDSCKVK
jgi:histidinol-phosphate/aromatic aminotransferase/cobyric acid decarboxylase-like protein